MALLLPSLADPFNYGNSLSNLHMRIVRICTNIVLIMTLGCAHPPKSPPSAEALVLAIEGIKSWEIEPSYTSSDWARLIKASQEIQLASPSTVKQVIQDLNDKHTEFSKLYLALVVAYDCPQVWGGKGRSWPPGWTGRSAPSGSYPDMTSGPIAWKGMVPYFVCGGLGYSGISFYSEAFGDYLKAREQGIPRNLERVELPL